MRGSRQGWDEEERNVCQEEIKTFPLVFNLSVHSQWIKYYLIGLIVNCFSLRWAKTMAHSWNNAIVIIALQAWEEKKRILEANDYPKIVDYAQ